MCARVRACVCARVRACVCVCAGAGIRDLSLCKMWFLTICRTENSIDVLKTLRFIGDAINSGYLHSGDISTIK